MPRRRKKGEQVDDNVDLSGDEHAWWAGRDDLDAGIPQGKKPRTTVEDTARQSVFQAYYSNESLFAPLEEIVPLPADPYVALGLDERASWDEITSAHRRLAKLHHPDRLTDMSAADRARSEERIRDLNIAYTELRRRRGK